MAKTSSSPTVRRRGPDPTGRLDLCAIRLLEHAVGTYGDIPLRGIYGTYKPEIDRAIKHHLGWIRFYVPPQLQQLVQPTSPPPPLRPKPAAAGPIFTLKRGKDGVYEVQDA